MQWMERSPSAKRCVPSELPAQHPHRCHHRNAVLPSPRFSAPPPRRAPSCSRLLPHPLLLRASQFMLGITGYVLGISLLLELWAGFQKSANAGCDGDFTGAVSAYYMAIFAYVGKAKELFCYYILFCAYCLECTFLLAKL